MKKLLVPLLLLLSLAAPHAHAQEDSFLQENDLWVCLGDSITHADTYRRTLERVARFYHPDANLRFVNGGKPGALASASKEAFEKAAANDKPTVVSIMFGMNNAINSAWRKGQPMDQALQAYRESLVTQTRRFKANGLTVILLSPTYTDESLGWASIWELAGTREFLVRCGQIVKEVAQAEGALYLPVGEEFEARQAALDAPQVLRPDGVHPAALGEYQIATTFLTHLRFSGKLAGKRELATAEPLPVTLQLVTRRLEENQRKVTFTLTGQGAVALRWSCGKARGEEKLTLAGAGEWSLELPQEISALPAGQADDLVLELAAGDRRSVYLVDLSSTAVLRLKDGVVRGVIEAPAETAARPEGKTIAAWTIRRDNKDLAVEVEAFDSEIRGDDPWPWARDGLTLWTDYRPADRFGGINLDSDVHQTILNLQPADAGPLGNLRPWLGRGMDAAATWTLTPTPTGYKVRLRIAGKFAKHADADLSRRDTLGINLVVVDCDTIAGGKKATAFFPLQPTRYAADQYAHGLLLLDLKNQIQGDRILQLHATRLR